jgi:hypothetical protein
MWVLTPQYLRQRFPSGSQGIICEKKTSEIQTNIEYICNRFFALFPNFWSFIRFKEVLLIEFEISMDILDGIFDTKWKDLILNWKCFDFPSISEGLVSITFCLFSL